MHKTAVWLNVISRNSARLFKFAGVFAAILGGAYIAYAQQATDKDLIDQWIQSQGNDLMITFDATNIKQYWIDKTVVCKDGLINVLLPKNESSVWKSVPLKIQLSNVNENQDCKIQIITKDPDLKVSVTDKDSNVLTSSSQEQDFIQFHIVSTLFHLDDSKDFSFNLVFSSQKKNDLEINSIVLSFAENKQSHFSGSPGFDILSKQIEKEGIAVPDSEVKYLISKEHNKIFIMLPEKTAEAQPFMYHVIPVDKSNLASGREQYGFNNMDFSVKTRYATIPKPYASKSEFTIIHRSLPSYPCSYIRIAPYDKKWTIEF